MYKFLEKCQAYHLPFPSNGLQNAPTVAMGSSWFLISSLLLCLIVPCIQQFPYGTKSCWGCFRWLTNTSPYYDQGILEKRFFFSTPIFQKKIHMTPIRMLVGISQTKCLVYSEIFLHNLGDNIHKVLKNFIMSKISNQLNLASFSLLAKSVLYD